MGLFDRFKKRDKSLEGSWRGPFMGVGELGGLHQFDPLGDGWQRNITRPEDAEKVPTIYACVMAIARSISQCYPKHVRRDARKFESITNSAAFRTLKNPNEYQSSPEFLLNMVAAALFKGESFAIAARNKNSDSGLVNILNDKRSVVFISNTGREPVRAASKALSNFFKSPITAASPPPVVAPAVTRPFSKPAGRTPATAPVADSNAESSTSLYASDNASRKSPSIAGVERSAISLVMVVIAASLYRLILVEPKLN